MTGGVIDLSRLKDGRYLSFQIRELAGEIVGRLDRARPGSVARMRKDTFAEISSWRELTVNVSHVSDSSACSVAGHFNPRTKIITVTRASPGRQSFTLLHEMAHYLQQEDDSWVDEVLAKEPDFGRRLEEQVCEAVAAEVLLGGDEISRILGDRTPAANSALELFRKTQASRAACCVATAQRLNRTGWVLLTDLSGTIQFGIGSGDRTPPQRGVNQGPRHLSVRAAERGAARGVDEWVTWKSGRRWEGLHGDAVRDDRGEYVFVVLTDEEPPWSPSPMRLRAPVYVEPEPWECHACGDTSPYPPALCDTCGESRCPACKACACVVRRSELKCKDCNLILPRSQFAKSSDTCRGCSI